MKNSREHVDFVIIERDNQVAQRMLMRGDLVLMKAVRMKPYSKARTYGMRARSSVARRQMLRTSMSSSQRAE